MTDYYDYIILTITNPAFSDNVDIMISNGLRAGGTSPSIITRTIQNGVDGEDEPIYVTKPIQGPMPGTKEVTGRVLLHFRLPSRLTEVELTTMLESGMSKPKPPLSVESIRSSQKIIEVSDGLDGEGNPLFHFEYETLIPAKRSRFLPYIPENVDINGNPDGTINEHLSTYYGSDPILLQ